MTGTDPVVTVTGARELRASLKRAGQDLQDLKDVNTAVAEIVATAARGRVRHRTGAMAGTVRAGKAAGRATVRAGSKRVPYVGIYEYGWPARHITGDHAIIGAAHDTLPQWSDVYRDGIQAILDKVEGA